MLYFGCIRAGVPEGIGIKFENSKCIDLGHFRRGRLQGHGKRIFAKGHVFVGEFDCGEMGRPGIFFNQSLSKWERLGRGSPFACNSRS